jgi:hypothetical protein
MTETSAEIEIETAATEVTGNGVARAHLINDRVEIMIK